MSAVAVLKKFFGHEEPKAPPAADVHAEAHVTALQDVRDQRKALRSARRRAVDAIDDFMGDFSNGHDHAKRDC